MKKRRRVHRTMALSALSLALPLGGYAQWIHNGSDSESLTNPTSGITVGTDAGAPPSALTVRGNEMDTPTGEVFRTDAPNGSTTNWRLLRGGTEYGRLFNEAANAHFTLNAPEGHLRWQTNDLLRMQLNQTQNSTINGFTVPTDGFLGLGRLPVGSAAPGTPWSRLHLHDADAVGSVVQAGYRDWMRNGVTMTGHGDHMFVGHKYGAGANDATDAVFQWADNGGSQQGPDLMRFIFTGAHTGAASGENSLFGREIMQLHPQGLIGLGDWNAASVAAGSTVSPTERLDVLDGNVRIRELPTLADANTLDKYMVVDNNGVVKWRNLPAFTSAGCDWETLTGTQRVATAWRNPGTNGSCPDRRWRVGIGTASPACKFDIYHTEEDNAVSGGLRVILLTNSAGWRSGINTTVEPMAGGTDLAFATGVSSHLNNVGLGSAGIADGYALLARHTTDQALFVRNSIGANGDAVASAGTLTFVHGGLFTTRGNGGTITNGYGVHASTTLNSGSMVTAYGVYGRATGAQTNYSVYGASPGSGATDWAGYFGGRTYVGGTIFTPSDSNLKTGIEPVANATEKILGLHPKSYHFDVAGHPHMGLPEGLQYGFLAPELQEQFPEMVIETLHPAELDTMGQEIHPAVPFKAVSTAGITPILVAAFQEQHQAVAAQQAELDELRALVTEQAARMEAMEAALSACCTAPDGSQRIQLLDEGAIPPTNDRKLMIVPNPFSEPPTVFYTLESGGRMQLLVNSSDGRDLRVLEEAVREAGEYRHEWNTTGLAPGVYYVTLLLDGEPVVKKAVKVQ